MPGLSALAVEASPPNLRGQALALHRQAGDAAWLATPIVLGAIVDVADSTSLSICTSAFFSAAAALFFRARYKSDSSLSVP